jgi:hypothetical protein
MKSFFKVLTLAGLALISALGIANAQVSQLVTPTATLQASPGVLCAANPAVNTATACVTPVPQAGQSVYVTAVYYDVCTNGTGTAQNNVNYTLTGASGFASATAITTYSMAATASICQHWGDQAGGAVLFKSLPGTPITITPPTAATNNSTGSRVYGYIAP